MNTTEKNTTTTTTTTTTGTEKGKDEKTMKNTTPTTTGKNTNTRKDSLPENIKQARGTLSGDMKALEKLLNTPTTGEKYATLSAKVNEKRGAVGKDLNTLNALLALAYYKKNPLFDIVKAGEAVPAVVIEEKEDGGKYTLTLKNTLVKPTLSGMKSAGVIDEEVIARVDTLRRVVAFVKSENTARVYLTGDTENKKDCPTEKVSAMIAGMGDISKNKARGLLTRVFKDLTGDTYKKEVLPRLYDEFAGYITKRANKWGERAIVGKSTACDMVLEFAWMYFNGKTEFKYIAG